MLSRIAVPVRSSVPVQHKIAIILHNQCDTALGLVPRTSRPIRCTCLVVKTRVEVGLYHKPARVFGSGGVTGPKFFIVLVVINDQVAVALKGGVETAVVAIERLVNAESLLGLEAVVALEKWLGLRLVQLKPDSALL